MVLSYLLIANMLLFLLKGIGSEPGSVDIFDLENLKLIDHVKVGKQAGGIAFWKMTD